jgi:hypothetical protein
MPVIIPCVKCHRKLRVLDRLLGKLVKCPGCQTKFVAPANGAAAATPGAAKPSSARALGRPAAPKSQPPSRAPAGPVQRTPPPSKAPLTRPFAPAASRGRAGPASSPSQEITVEQGEEDFMAGPAPSVPRTRPQLGEGEPTGPLSGKRPARRPKQSSFLRVFVTLGGILLATTILGLLCALWVNAGVQSRQGRYKDQPQPNQVK